MGKKAKRLSKDIWFDEFRWKVVKYLRPTKHDEYVLLRRKCERTIHSDGVVPVIMVLLDCSNDAHYPDTLEVRQAIGRMVTHKDKDTFDKEILSDAWLELVQ